MYNEELMRKENVPSSWFLMTLLNHGYTLEEAIKIKIKDLSYIRIFKNRERRIKEYKSKLLSINIDNSKGFHYDRI
jgi:hypothetical protein